MLSLGSPICATPADRISAPHAGEGLREGSITSKSAMLFHLPLPVTLWPLAHNLTPKLQVDFFGLLTMKVTAMITVAVRFPPALWEHRTAVWIRAESQKCLTEQAACCPVRVPRTLAFPAV